jgi:predicted small lipoprotein YifL
LTSSSSIWTARSAVIGAVIVIFISAVGLAACGRKGGLDPPPVAAPVPVDERGVPIQPAAAPEGAPAGVAPAPPARKATWLDWLIN